MKKAAIISLYGNNNYGNKLQNYAVQEILKKHNFAPITIANIPLLNNKYVSKKELIKYELKCIYFWIKYGDKKIYNLNHYEKKERKKNFLEFNRNIISTRKIFSFKKIKDFEDYNYYFVGSDQIWNPELGGLSDLDLLTFTSGQKISISASFGVDKIPSKFKAKIKKYLSSFNAISVREIEGKKIINDVLPKKEVSVLIDPTLMLTPKEWDKVIKKPKNNMPNKKYILCYFLGELSREKKSKIEEFANKQDMEIIYLLDKNSIYNVSGPSEFLYLEKNANLVLTDSYHSSIFSILYKVPLVIFDREGLRNNMKSRINTLVKTFNLNDRYYDSSKDLIEYIHCDYQIDDIINEKRAEFNEFMKKIK